MRLERPYQKLVTWQVAHDLCKKIYAVTAAYPADEKFGLVSQMRRAVSSIPMNIAEGNAKHSKKDHAHFLEIALGSIEELHYQCLLSHELRYMPKSVFEELTGQIQRTGFLLSKLRASLLP